jgi:hypothetical protein
MSNAFHYSGDSTDYLSKVVNIVDELVKLANRNRLKSKFLIFNFQPPAFIISDNIEDKKFVDALDDISKPTYSPISTFMISDCEKHQTKSDIENAIKFNRYFLSILNHQQRSMKFANELFITIHNDNIYDEPNLKKEYFLKCLKLIAEYPNRYGHGLNFFTTIMLLSLYYMLTNVMKEFSPNLQLDEEETRLYKKYFHISKFKPMKLVTLYNWAMSETSYNTVKSIAQLNNCLK